MAAISALTDSGYEDPIGGRRPEPMDGGPAPSVPATDPYADRKSAVGQWYQGYLGRQGSPDEINGWATNPNFGTVQQAIANSQEAQQYKTRAAQPAAAPATADSGGDWIGDALRAVQSTDDPNYWRQVISQHNDLNNPAARDYWIDRIRRGDGSALVKSGQLQTFQDGGGSAATSGSTFSDPATTQWEQLLRQLVERMNQPQPAYTPSQLDLLQTQAIDPLERQRQAQKQQVTQQLSQRGIVPGSGIFDEAMANIDRQFNQLRTQTQANFATQQVGREDQQFANNEQRSLNAVNLFKQIPQYADSRLQLASNTLIPANPYQTLSLANQYQNQQQQNQQYQNAQNQQFYGQLANLIYSYFSGRGQ